MNAKERNLLTSKRGGKLENGKSLVGVGMQRGGCCVSSQRQNCQWGAGPKRGLFRVAGTSKMDLTLLEVE